MAVVRVPKTPRKAFDRHRRPSTLLLGQIEHLEWAVLPASQRTPDQLPTQKVKTEAQAAERVGQLTKLLLDAKAAEGTARAAGAAAPVILPPLPKMAAPRKRRPGTPTATTRRSAQRRRSGR